MSKSFTVNEVKEHNTVDNGLYIIIDGGVYEMVNTPTLYLSSQFISLCLSFLKLLRVSNYT